MTGNEIYRAEARQLLNAFRRTHDLDFLLKSMIAVLDSFDRLLSDFGNGSMPDESKALLVTCGRIARQVESAVSAAGLISFGERGEILDLDRHEVIDVAQREGVAEDIIIEVVRRGYEKDGAVVRPAEVIVAAQPPEEPSA